MAGPGSVDRIAGAVRGLDGAGVHHTGACAAPAGLRRVPASRAAGERPLWNREALPNNRFIPYIQIHEFEALAFVDLDVLPSQFPDGEADGAPARLRQDVGFTAPEDINDGSLTAPSKRLIHEVPAYEHMKSIAGPALAARIGLATLRAACPHLNAWITRLEQLSTWPT